MIDLIERMDLAEVFDFDKFHDAFRQLRQAAKGGECLNIPSYINDNPDFWNNYDITKTRSITRVLISEIYSLYELVADPDDNIILPKAEKKIPQKNTEPTIREFAKRFLEIHADEPQDLSDILEYVNQHRKCATSYKSLCSSLSSDKQVFKSFGNGKWGLCSLPYEKIFAKTIADTHDTETDLTSQNFMLRYSSKRVHKPTEFFTKALSNSSTLCLGLGYFSSACFNVLACGFAHFVRNGGNLRMYINPHVTEDDYNMLRNKDHDGIEASMLQSYDRLLQTFSRRDKLFFKCLSYLISKNRIEVKIVLLRDNGIAHEKFGVFTDSSDNKVAFNGSMNLTAAGLTRNIEAIDCSCSWHNEESIERIACYQEDFDNIWNGENQDVHVFDAVEFCKQIVSKYPTDNVDELIMMENEVIRDLEQEESKYSADEPHFPKKFKDGPRPYQIEAYEAWRDRGKQGVFAMATGTGKTVTSLNCALEEYMDSGFYHLLILVPSLALVEQWGDEVDNFNFRNVIKISSDNHKWKKEVASIVSKMRMGKVVDYVLISTYQSFVMADFQLFLPKLSDGTLLIADEAHNIGSASVREAFHKMTIKKRIALSATPNRVYDEEGTREIESFFNDSYPYTYSFSMRRAIKEERLMPYKYFPYLAKLEEDEMEKYAKITRQLVQLYDGLQRDFADPEKARKLLLIRKNILHKAKNKMDVFKKIIKEIGEERLKYCFVYSAAGKRNRIEESDNEELDDYILKEMQCVLKQTYPYVTCNSYTGHDSKQIRKQKLEAFAAGKINVLFAKNCLDEGVDVPRAEYGIFTSSSGNPRQFIQRRGRLLRKHEDKLFAWIYDIVVVPNFTSPYYERRFWTMEKHLVENEMRRVANFGALASNYYTGALSTLEEVINFYEIDLNGMVLNEE